MATYRYTAKTQQGETVTGMLTANGAQDVVRQLRAQQLLPLQIQEIAETAATTEAAAGAVSGAGDAAVVQAGAMAAPDASAARPARAGFDLRRIVPFGSKNVPLKELALFSRQFATMVGAGLSILISLRVLAEQTEVRNLKSILFHVADNIERGDNLSGAFARHVPAVPELMVNMLEAGEAGGILVEVFERLSDHFEHEAELHNKVRSALIYPKIVLSVAALMIVFLLVFILPMFADFFSQFDVEMPKLTQVVLALGDWVRSNILLLVIAALALYCLYKLIPQTPAGRRTLDRIALRIPVLGELYLKRSFARFTRTLGTLLNSGVPILAALRVAEKTLDNVVLEASVARARENVRAGRTLAAPLRENPLFPRMLVELVAVGEETGALDAMLYKAADFFERETRMTVERLTSLLEPLIITARDPARWTGAIGLLLRGLNIPVPQPPVIEDRPAPDEAAIPAAAATISTAPDPLLNPSGLAGNSLLQPDGSPSVEAIDATMHPGIAPQGDPGNEEADPSEAGSRETDGDAYADDDAENDEAGAGRA